MTSSSVCMRAASPGQRLRHRALRYIPQQRLQRKQHIIMILINDELQADMYKRDIEPNLEEGNMLMFAHGFNIHFGCIKPPKNVRRHHDRSEGHRVTRSRSEYQAGKGATVPDRGRAGCNGRRLETSASHTALGIGGARAGRFGDHLPYRDRDRPLRRAGCSLRRRLRSDAGWFRDAG